MTYTRKRLIESQLKLWKGLRRDYIRDRDAAVQGTTDWHSYNTIITELNEKIKAAEMAWREQK